MREIGFSYMELLDFFDIKENTVSDKNKKDQLVMNTASFSKTSFIKPVEQEQNRFPFFPFFEFFLAGLVSKCGDHQGVRIKTEQIRKLLNNNSNH
ncbi:MAG: hypothetical protein LBU34_05605 [Planctomycetaceae bacterium]|nr:hypothetical protein [Planctomycetaceae bacterium]